MRKLSPGRTANAFADGGTCLGGLAESYSVAPAGPFWRKSTASYRVAIVMAPSPSTSSTVIV